MYHGKYQEPHSKCKHSRGSRKTVSLLISLLLIFAISLGGTLAYLSTKTNPVENTFRPSHVTCQVTESFDATTKSNVNVINTGDTEAYIRVKLVSYRVNDKNQHIGGTATIPKFSLGTDWVHYGNHYYYTLPVEPGMSPSNDLADSIVLKDSYNDADGGKQVIEVMAEAIQSGPTEAVGKSWGVSITQGIVTAYQG